MNAFILKSLAAALAIAAILTQPAQLARAQPEPVTVRVAGVLSDEMTPILYAQKTGMYAKAGLDVQVVPAATGTAVATSILAGSVEIGKSSLISLLNAHLRGVPLSIISGTDAYDPAHPYAEMTVPADSPIATAKDLYGKTIGVPSLNDLNELAADSWLDKNGGDSKSVKFIEIPNSSMVPMMADKRIDAAVMTHPYLGEALATHSVKALGPAYGAIAKSFLISVWFVSTDWATKHPAVIKTFLDVTNRSTLYTNAHHAETAPLVADITKIPVDVILNMPRAMSTTELHLADIQSLIDAAAKYKLIPEAFPAKTLILPGIPVR